MDSGFKKEYWEKNYSDLEHMDGIGNVKEHVGYMKYLLALEFIDVSSVVDFGFGLGHLFEGVLKEFVPYRAYGIEPSEFAYEQVKKRGISPEKTTKLILKKQGLVDWCLYSEKVNVFDLGVCTSVFQYLSNEEIKLVLPVLASKVRYLYFSVPTDKELKKQVDDLGFFDEFAISRTRNWYQKQLKKYFTFVSSRMLESKAHFDEESTFFTDLLFRF